MEKNIAIEDINTVEAKAVAETTTETTLETTPESVQAEPVKAEVSVKENEKKDDEKKEDRSGPIERENKKRPSRPKPLAKKDSSKTANPEDPVKTEGTIVQEAVAEPDMSDRRIISQSGRKRVQTEQDKYNENLLDLVKSAKGGQILTGVVEGVETYRNSLIVAVLHRGAFKVIIPSDQFLESFPEFKPQMGYKSKQDMIRIMMGKRIGSEIDFLIKGEIDTASDVAVGSRVDAMTRKRNARYIHKDQQGNRFVYEGALVEARVQVVARSGIIVEIQGIETFIPLQELSYTRCRDAGELFVVGDLKLAKVLKIEIGEDNSVKVKASLKAAEENPIKKLLPQLQKDGMYGGTVSMVTIHGVFVALDNGAECLCKYPSFGVTPVGGSRVVIRLTIIDEERLRMMGIIVSVQLPREE